MGRIFIYGAPGCGKTFLTNKLSSLMQMESLELDTIRQYAQEGKTIQSDPFLFLGTTEAYKQFGDLNEENVIRGLKGVRAAMKGFVEAKIRNKGGGLIIEGAFIDPNIPKEEDKILLVIKTDEEQHLEQYLLHREITKESIEFFRSARILQEYLINEAKKLGIETVESNQKNILRGYLKD